MSDEDPDIVELLGRLGAVNLAQIRHCIETVGCPDGGLMLIYGLYPGVPLENVKALMDAMSRYADFYR